MALSENIKKLRLQKKYSQEKLAEALDVSRQAVSKWEMGVALPDTKKLLQLSEIFEVSLDELTDRAVLNESVQNTDTFQKHKGQISRFVCAAYGITFGSLMGFFCPPITNYPYPYMIFVATGLIGGIMLVLKNRDIVNKNNTTKVRLMDIAAILLACVMGKLIPNYMGLVKALIIFILIFVYLQFIFRRYFYSRMDH